ncbi:nucleoside-diphosphate sugar epimerase [Clostridia bacterium]|nr:nucleoside-diphosphate sugar epimerase [Clostridia bacterium]
MTHRIRKFILYALDVILVPLSGFFTLWLRFDGDFNIEPNGMKFLSNLLFGLPFVTLAALVIFTFFGLYKSLWEYAGINELMRIFGACGITALFTLAFHTLSGRPIPRSSYLVWGIVLLFFVGASRISFRVYRRFRYGFTWKVNPFAVFSRVKSAPRQRVMVIGAGDMGSAAIHQRVSDASAHIVCVVDDDPRKRGMLINGVPVLGTRGDIARLAEDMGISEIIVAVPPLVQAEILNLCKATGARLKIQSGDAAGGIRDVNITDLLGRGEVHLDDELIAKRVRGKTVLVTGGGGSIGSELCRHIARLSPKTLVVFDVVENNMYLLQRELLAQLPDLNFVPIIGTVRSTLRLESVFDEYRPDLVFHAAAHKHVPLMESNPCECVKNNVLGTYNVAAAAVKFGVSRFVLISSDKAVNPTNVYGASKRVCEMIIQGFMRRDTGTEFVAVRFGNVLGSDGSIIHIWNRQIANGGPVTVTHPDAIRFFMTIPEAARLVIRAAASAKGGEIFILDMGKPVRIMELAKDLIRLSGFEPERDIAITVTGLRPGEKLYEELLMSEEGLTATKHKKIFVGKPLDVDWDGLNEQLARLKDAAERQDNASVVTILKECVPTYAAGAN